MAKVGGLTRLTCNRPTGKNSDGYLNGNEINSGAIYRRT